MSSQFEISDSTILLQHVQKYLYQYGGLIIVVLGFISCVFRWIVFKKKTLRKNPCSIYMTAFQIFNFAHIIIIILPSTLLIGYDIATITSTLGLCRFTSYMAFVLDILSPSCLILASIDRLLVTSPHALTRQRSTCRLAFISLICISLLWFLSHSHALILMHLIELGPNTVICYSQTQIYLIVINYYIFVKNIIIPLILASLGILTIRNVRKIRQNVVAVDASRVGTGNHRGIQSVYSKDRQLVRILLIDIGIYVICTYPLTGTNLYLQITQYNTKNFDRQQADILIQYFCSFCGFIPYCIGLYSNLFVSKIFRKEVKNIFLCK
ncbi:hypothetical protein I4U23_004331 [Adineta vaga]|nr:hypothetical protein I4U23_004331 [Adineta vaga]